MEQLYGIISRLSSLVFFAYISLVVSFVHIHREYACVCVSMCDVV